MSTAMRDRFAELLVQQVRDAAIEACDSMLQPHADSFRARRWRKACQSPECIREVIPDIVDDAIFALLLAIDNEVLSLRYVSPDGSSVDLAELGNGEMAGAYLGDDGWRKRFARQRFHDYVEPGK